MNDLASDQIPGAQKPAIVEMPRVKDRMTFIYLEKCSLSREDSALRVEDRTGYVLIPSHCFLTLLLGPGVTLTHRAAELLGDSGSTIVWVGEGGTKYYGSGRPLTAGSALLQKQAEIASRPRMRMEAVRKMYALRFPEENLEGLTLQQLRGKEGARVKNEYKRQSEQWNVPWNGRQYDPQNFHDSDPINQALSLANVYLYGLTQAVTTALGLSPGLGMIHVGHEKSFIYDIADLYKAETSIPCAFEIISTAGDAKPALIRKKMRELFQSLRLIERMVEDIKIILSCSKDDEQVDEAQEVLALWDGTRGLVESGVQYDGILIEGKKLA